jgi:hypothetical protein
MDESPTFLDNLKGILQIAFGDLKEICRDLKWIIAVCLLICAIIYLPAQVIELFRVSAAEGGRVAVAQFVALVLISFFIFIGAQQVTTQTLASGTVNSKTVGLVARLVVAILTGLPLFLAAIAQTYAKPTIATTSSKALLEVGSAYRVQEESLRADASTLDDYFWYLLAICVAAMVAAFLLSGRRKLSESVNRLYFSKPIWLLGTILFTAVRHPGYFHAVRRRLLHPFLPADHQGRPALSAHSAALGRAAVGLGPQRQPRRPESNRRRSR